jgi:hypothetical protein
MVTVADRLREDGCNCRLTKSASHSCSGGLWLAHQVVRRPSLTQPCGGLSRQDIASARRCAATR